MKIRSMKSSIGGMFFNKFTSGVDVAFDRT